MCEELGTNNPGSGKSKCQVSEEKMSWAFSKHSQRSIVAGDVDKKEKELGPDWREPHRP